MRLLSVLLVTAILAPSALAAPASEAESYYLGDYAVRTDDDRPTRCRVAVLWADDVGGQFTSKGCEAWPDVAAAARWGFDAESGEARFRDPLHKQRFRLVETDAGFVAVLNDETRLWFESLPPAAR